MNTLLCDNMCSDFSGCPRVDSRDVQVLTLVFSNAVESDNISLDVYYPADNSSIANRVTTMPSYGLFSWHLQGVEMNSLAMHRRSEGNLPMGQGWRYTCTLRYSSIFQETPEFAVARLERCGISIDQMKLVTRDKYQYHLDGSSASFSLASLEAFPGVG